MNPFTLDTIRLLQHGEAQLRLRSLGAIENDEGMRLHLEIIRCAMDVLDVFRQFNTEDQDVKVIQVLGIRQFNAFASALNLACSGYYQNSGLILRDVLETVFLIDYFRTEPSAIAKWRHADRVTRLKDFKPVKIRQVLDERDGLKTKKRAEHYEMFSELAAHATMSGIQMLRPKGADIHMGPFLDITALDATIGEMGRLATQVGEVTGSFVPVNWPLGKTALVEFNRTKIVWFKRFHPSSRTS